MIIRTQNVNINTWHLNQTNLTGCLLRSNKSKQVKKQNKQHMCNDLCILQKQEWHFEKEMKTARPVNIWFFEQAEMNRKQPPNMLQNKSCGKTQVHQRGHDRVQRVERSFLRSQKNVYPLVN